MIGDLISRSELIKAFEPEHYFDWYTPSIIETINEQPTVDTVKEQPKVGEWIPVSERLPEEDGKYIVCTMKGSVYCAKYSNDCKYFHADSYTHIIAWMPLPEPYKE